MRENYYFRDVPQRHHPPANFVRSWSRCVALPRSPSAGRRWRNGRRSRGLSPSHSWRAPLVLRRVWISAGCGSYAAVWSACDFNGTCEPAGRATAGWGPGARRPAWRSASHPRNSSLPAGPPGCRTRTGSHRAARRRRAIATCTCPAVVGTRSGLARIECRAGRSARALAKTAASVTVHGGELGYAHGGRPGTDSPRTHVTASQGSGSISVTSRGDSTLG